MELLKQNNARYTSDVWLLIKEENQINNANFVQNIKKALLDKIYEI